jgi:hypothetical protein
LAVIVFEDDKYVIEAFVTLALLDNNVRIVPVLTVATFEVSVTTLPVIVVPTNVVNVLIVATLDDKVITLPVVMMPFVIVEFVETRFCTVPVLTVATFDVSVTKFAEVLATNTVTLPYVVSNVFELISLEFNKLLSIVPMFAYGK